MLWHGYIRMQKASGLVGIVEAFMAKLSYKNPQEAWQNSIARYSLDNSEVIIELTKPDGAPVAGDFSQALEDWEIFSGAGEGTNPSEDCHSAANYISANIENWETY